MTGYHDIDASSIQVDVELVPIVDEMHGEGREFERQRVGVGFCPMCAVDVSSNGADWCEFTKAFEFVSVGFC